MASISSDSYFTGVFAGVAADAPPEKTRARGALETRGILVGEGEVGHGKTLFFFFFWAVKCYSGPLTLRLEFVLGCPVVAVR